MQVEMYVKNREVLRERQPEVEGKFPITEDEIKAPMDIISKRMKEIEQTGY